MKKQKTSFKVALGGIISAVCLIAMFCSGFLPMLDYAIPTFAGFLMVVMIVEVDRSWAITTYIAVSLLCPFLTPNIQAAALFIIFMGYYPILKYGLDQRKNKVLAWIIKFAVFNAAMALFFFLFTKVFVSQDMLDGMESFGKWAILVLWAAANFFFLLYEYALTQLIELSRQSLFLLHCIKDLSAAYLIPRRRDYRSAVVVSSQDLNALIQFFLIKAINMAQYDRAGMFHLVFVEFTEILHIEFALFCIDYSRESVKLDIFVMKILNRDYNIRQLPDAGRLDKDPLRSVFVDHLLQSSSEITDESAANASRVHLIDLYTCLLQKASVYADLAEFVLDEDQFFIAISLSNEFLDKRRFPRS